MILHNDSSYMIYFGDCKDPCVKSNTKISLNCLKKIKNRLHLEKIIVLNQLHGIKGICLKDLSTSFSEVSFMQKTGDYIITNISKIGIGVLTADCLPIIFYDPVHNIIAIAHAGWRGAVKEIAKNLIQKMEQSFNTYTQKLIVYLAPSAKFCCYQVDNKFLNHLENSTFINQVILKRQNKYFFDLPKFVRLQLLDLGIKENNIHQNYNDCTICNTKFCSFRRQNGTSSRQVTVVALK
ncbi:peptidoglycan editing factor PgeF [Candidatus Dependentiae bacterium]